MTLRWVVIGGNALFLMLDGPGEWADIAHAVFHPDAFYHWRLALGLTIKNTLVLATIIGLLRNQRYGYVCLLAESVHSMLIRSGAFAAVMPVGVTAYLPQLILPTVDIAFRLFCIGYFLNWNRKEGVLAKT